MTFSGSEAVSKFSCPENVSGVCALEPKNSSQIREVSAQRLNQTFTSLSWKLAKETLVSGANEVFLSLDHGVEFTGAGSGTTELKIVVQNSDADAAGDKKSTTSDSVSGTKI